MSHDGLTHDELLAGAIEETLASLGAMFQRWITAGHIDPGLGQPADLAYALMAPVVMARLLWLYSDAAPRVRRAARDRAARHAELFARAVFRARQARVTPSGR